MKIFRTDIVCNLCSGENPVILGSILAWDDPAFKLFLASRTELTGGDQAEFDGIAKELLGNPCTFLERYLGRLLKQADEGAEKFIWRVVEHFTYSSIQSQGLVRQEFSDQSLMDELVSAMKFIPNPKEMKFL